jgi:formate hydrogenlyase transcriptional activator
VSQDGDRRPVILVVDDTPANLGVLFNLLGQAGFEVLIAEDGESAVQRAAHAGPDLILLDVLMPHLDGFATCERLKQDPASRDIPIIFMTALSDTIDKVRGFEAGAVDYVTKPFQLDELLARVRAHLTIQQLRVKLQESEDRLSRVFESAMDAIVTIDGAGRITLFNAAAERVFRLPASEAVGAPFGPLVSDRFRAVLEGYTSQGAGARAAIWLPEGLTAVRADREEFPVEATLSHADVAGAPLFTIILRDIEERRRAEAERQRLENLTQYLQDEVQTAVGPNEPVGMSPALRRVLRSVDQVAPTDSTVLLTGETGTGKELIARALHTRSRRKEAVLVKVNCAAIPAALIESDLFGHEKGAFTGAVARKIGRFELAHGGTLFLDEIGELPLDLQPKLLRALQEGEIERVGSTHTLRVDVRVIAATNRDLEAACRDGRFRPDLFYRLNVFPIRLPPLRERREDIPALVAHFVRKHAAKLGRRIERVPDRLMMALAAYPWPGNVRELEHVVERAMIVSEGPELAATEWLRQPDTAPASARIATLEEAERAHILAVLEATGWRVSGPRGAAECLGLRPTTLESRMKKLGVERKR